MSVESANTGVGGNINPTDNHPGYSGVNFDAEMAKWPQVDGPSSNGKTARSSGGNLKWIIISILLVILSVAAVIVAFIASSDMKKKAEEQKRDEISQNYGADYLSIDSIRERYSKNTDEYYDAMQALIDDAKYDENKAQILLYRAEDLSSAKDEKLLEKALEDAYRSERLNQTIQSAYWISEIEGMLGNQKKSEEYRGVMEKRAKENGSEEGEG